MKRKIKIGILYLAIGFAALFCFRLAYGYLSTSERSSASASQDYDGSSEFEFSRKNYASEKLKVNRSGASQPISVDQKYEKVASVSSRSTAFDEDEKTARELAAKYNALIQFEQSSGLAGTRRLNIAIGVPPEKFDSLVGEMKAIGKLISIRIDKTDKTNEYKDLNAKRVSLEKTRDAMVALKGRGGRIDESINLEDRILEIETEIQAMGVRLGEYDQENEFCTVKFGLEESGAALAQPQVSLIHRIKVALEWTVKYYLMIIALLLFASLLVLIAVVLLEKLKWVQVATATFVQKTEGL